MVRTLWHGTCDGTELSVCTASHFRPQGRACERAFHVLYQLRGLLLVEKDHEEDCTICFPGRGGARTDERHDGHFAGRCMLHGAHVLRESLPSLAPSPGLLPGSGCSKLRLHDQCAGRRRDGAGPRRPGSGGRALLDLFDVLRGPHVSLPHSSLRAALQVPMPVNGIAEVERNARERIDRQQFASHWAALDCEGCPAALCRRRQVSLETRRDLGKDAASLGANAGNCA
jgi:hypothetical protein